MCVVEKVPLNVCRPLKALQFSWHPWPLTSHQIRNNSQEIDKTFRGKKGKKPSGEQQRRTPLQDRLANRRHVTSDVITELQHIQWVWQSVWIVGSRHGPRSRPPLWLSVSYSAQEKPVGVLMFLYYWWVTDNGQLCTRFFFEYGLKTSAQELPYNCSFHFPRQEVGLQTSVHLSISFFFFAPSVRPPITSGAERSCQCGGHSAGHDFVREQAIYYFAHAAWRMNTLLTSNWPQQKAVMTSPPRPPVGTLKEFTWILNLNNEVAASKISIWRFFQVHVQFGFSFISLSEMVSLYPWLRGRNKMAKMYEK